MEKLSRSVHRAKQVKIWDADCTCPYSPYGDVEGSYHLYGRGRWMRWCIFIGQLSANTVLTCVQFEANNKETRGPLHGHHVSPFCLVYMVIKILLESAGLNPRPPTTQTSARPIHHYMFLVMYTDAHIFMLANRINWKGGGPVLSPDP